MADKTATVLSIEAVAELLRAQPVARVPRLALTIEEAAEALGIDDNTFNRYVRPKLKLVRLGRKPLVPVAQLQKYLEHAGVRAAE